jgi:phospholipase D1/2
MSPWAYACAGTRLLPPAPRPKLAAAILDGYPVLVDGSDAHHRDALLREPPTTEGFRLEPGRNCWVESRARRAAVLVDAEAYFATLYDAFRLARRRICIAGWDIDSRVELTRTPPAHGPSPRLGPLLDALVRARPELRVYILAWDYSPIYLFEREAFPRLKLGLRTHPRVRFCLDDTQRGGGSHHQKLVIVDDALAFCGGLDLCDVRWDTSEHRVPEPGRADVRGRRYAPHHDVQLAVDGPVAGALGQLFAHRWHGATGERLPPLPDEPSPWPSALAVDLHDVEVGVARTSHGRDGSTIREVEAAWLDAVAAARSRLYIEVCYLTAPELVEALARRLAEPDGPIVVLVAPRRHDAWLEDFTMLVLRDRALERLRRADVHGRLRAVGPAVRDPDDPSRMIPIKVHSKVVAVDDHVLKIGSSNATRRSFGLDSECDLVLVAHAAHQRRAIEDVVRRLVADHLGATPAEADAWLHHVEGPGALPPPHRSLEPLPPRRSRPADRLLPAEELVDPKAPLSFARVLRLLAHADGRGPLWASVGATWWLGAMALGVGARLGHRALAWLGPAR